MYSYTGGKGISLPQRGRLNNGLETTSSGDRCNYCRGEKPLEIRGIIRNPSGFRRTVSNFIFQPKGTVNIQERQEARQGSIDERLIESLPTDQYAMKVQSAGVHSL
jgi:hypothetical protein